MNKQMPYNLRPILLLAALALHVGCGKSEDPNATLLKQMVGKWDRVNNRMYFHIQPDGEVQEINDETKEVVAFGKLKMQTPGSLTVRLSSNTRFEFRPAGHDYLAVRITTHEGKQHGGGIVVERMSSEPASVKTPPKTEPSSEGKEASPKASPREPESTKQPRREKTKTAAKATSKTPTQIAYRTFRREETKRFAWMGEHVAFLTIQEDLDPVVMKKLCTTFDKVYKFYADATGTTPKPVQQHEGRLCIAEVENTCGAGCGHLGATGIELMPKLFQVLYDGVKKHDEYDQVLPYEFGRNFWFYSKQLGYRDGDKDNAIVTGYAVFMRFASLDAAGVSLGPFRDRSGTDFRNQVMGLVDLYESDTSLTWENTIKVDRAPKNSMGLNGTDLFAGFCFRLAKQHGGSNFIRQLWKEVATRPEAKTTQQAVDNFVLAASKAAGQDLTDLFANTWRWPVSDAARQESRGTLVAIAAFPDELKGPTSLTPEEAEKLICTDPTCRPQERTARYTVTKCVPETKTRSVIKPDGTTVEQTYTINVPVIEECTRTYTITMCGEELSLNGLTQLSAETAAVLARHQGILALDGLTDLAADAAKPLAACPASISLKGLKTLTPEIAKALFSRPGRRDLSGLTELSVDAARTVAGSSGAVTLNGLTALTPEVATELARSSSSLSLGGLRELSPGVAKSLAECRGPSLNLDGVGQITLDDARALANVPGSLSLGSLATVPYEVAELLCERSGKLSLNGLQRVDRAAFEVLSRKQALPHSVAVDNANSRIVVWKRKGAASLAEIQQTISEAVGIPVNIDKQVIDSLGTSLQDATATPPNRIMDASQAVQWLGRELSNGKGLVWQWSDKEIKLSASDKNPDPPAVAAATVVPPAEPPASKEQVIDQKTLRKAFGASRSSYDKKTGILTLAYDFSRPEQLKDWEMDNTQPAKARGGKGIRVGPAESLVHRAVFQEGRCSFTYRLGDVTDKGAVISAGKVATVNQREWNRRRFFVLNGRDHFHPDDKHATVENASILQFNVVVGIEDKRCVLTVDGAETAVPRQNKGTFQIMLNGGDNGGDFAAVTISGKPDMDWLMKALGLEEPE